MLILRSICSLASELNEKPTHFLLELIQNAEDNSYADGVVPSITLTLYPTRLTVDCNKKGFSEKNVRAICRPGFSTKRDKSMGYIGEKGIGFKSVFKVAGVVTTVSYPYSFRFEKHERLGMVTPIWVPVDYTRETKQGSHFTLDLLLETDAEALGREILDLEPSLLIFLRKLRQIWIRIHAVLNVVPEMGLVGS